MALFTCLINISDHINNFKLQTKAGVWMKTLPYLAHNPALFSVQPGRCLVYTWDPRFLEKNWIGQNTQLDRGLVGPG